VAKTVVTQIMFRRFEVTTGKNPDRSGAFNGLPHWHHSCCFGGKARTFGSACVKQNRRRNKVKRQRRFGTEVEAASTAAAQIKTLIDSLSRCQQSLDCDIATEEERTRCSDDSDPAYSVFARSLIPRRDNVAATIAILQARLSKTQAPTDGRSETLLCHVVQRL
jgi:hypothetical protein